MKDTSKKPCPKGNAKFTVIFQGDTFLVNKKRGGFPHKQQIISFYLKIVKQPLHW
uniref:Uncharacterized protein n=1 Tax=Vibrio tasmaniensis TaxID=212663 RepID=A0A0H4A1K9_9VIBR|nr:hypothetical protein [Vibrio tasmaniensis]